MLVHRPTERPNQRIDEDSPLDPLWAYPESKAKTEALLRERHGDIPVVLLRIAGVYDDMGHSAFLAEQISRIYEHRAAENPYPAMLFAAQSDRKSVGEGKSVSVRVDSGGHRLTK